MDIDEEKQPLLGNGSAEINYTEDDSKGDKK